MLRPRSSSFRPHVWGFFFHCLLHYNIVHECYQVFVPMFGDSFFTSRKRCLCALLQCSFRPHVWGFFFHERLSWQKNMDLLEFSSPCLGILFSLSWGTWNVPFSWEVFVPMFGDSFFTLTDKLLIIPGYSGFRPHVWGFFFHSFPSKSYGRQARQGFRPHVWGFFFHNPQKYMERYMAFMVFVPMFGDSFFTLKNESILRKTENLVFVPMFGDSFFTAGPGGPTGWALYGPFAAGISN